MIVSLMRVCSLTWATLRPARWRDCARVSPMDTAPPQLCRAGTATQHGRSGPNTPLPPCPLPNRHPHAGLSRVIEGGRVGGGRRHFGCARHGYPACGCRGLADGVGVPAGGSGAGRRLAVLAGRGRGVGSSRFRRSGVPGGAGPGMLQHDPPPGRAAHGGHPRPMTRKTGCRCLCADAAAAARDLAAGKRARPSCGAVVNEGCVEQAELPGDHYRAA